MSEGRDFEIGALTAQVQALTKRLDNIEPVLNKLVAFIEQQKGGWRLLVVLATVSAAIGAGLQKGIAFLVSIGR
jgi:hypothetical protein